MGAQTKTTAVGIVLSLLVFGSLSNASPDDIEGQRPRDWTDVKGRNIHAVLVGIEKEAALLRMKGRVYRVPLTKLSEADREYIRSAVPKASSSTEAGRSSNRFQPAAPGDLNDGLVFEDGTPVLVRGDNLAAFKVMHKGKELSAYQAEALKHFGVVSHIPGEAIIEKRSGETYTAFVFPDGPHKGALIGLWYERKLAVREQRGNALGRTFTFRNRSLLKQKSEDIGIGTAYQAWYAEADLTDAETVVFKRAGWLETKPRLMIRTGSDSNNDGEFSEEELRRPLQQLLDKFDFDRDGAISRKEAPAYVDQRFAGADANGDGKLSEAEIVREFYDDCDANNDGRLTEADRALRGIR